MADLGAIGQFVTSYASASGVIAKQIQFSADYKPTIKILRQEVQLITNTATDIVDIKARPNNPDIIPGLDKRISFFA